MKKILSLTIILAMSILQISAQMDVKTGKYKNSFVLSWKDIDSIQMYEYVLTDNSKCFRGCSGDTKSDTVEGNTILVFPNFENKNYYWKVRPVLTNGDTVEYWSGINTFVAEYPEEPTADIAVLFPNPSIAGELTIRIDWSLLENENLIDYVINDLKGNVIISPAESLKKLDREVRFSSYSIDVQNLKSGIYILNIQMSSKGVVQQLRFEVK